MKVKQIGKYSVDIEVDHRFDFGNEIANMFAKEIQKEIDQEIRNQIRMQELENLGWTKVVVKDYRDITIEWCKRYIKNGYTFFGHFWYFEDQCDANYFILKWGAS